jgi:hypothetical protein
MEGATVGGGEDTIGPAADPGAEGRVTHDPRLAGYGPPFWMAEPQREPGG